MHLFKCLKCVLHSDVKNVVESYLTIKKSLTKQWICGMNVLLKGLKDIYWSSKRICQNQFWKMKILYALFYGTLIKLLVTVIPDR